MAALFKFVYLAFHFVASNAIPLLQYAFKLIAPASRFLYFIIG